MTPKTIAQLFDLSGKGVRDSWQPWSIASKMPLPDHYIGYYRVKD